MTILPVGDAFLLAGGLVFFLIFVYLLFFAKKIEERCCNFWRLTIKYCSSNCGRC